MPYFKTSDGLSLAYDDVGSGTPLLCLAGLTRNMDDFEPVVDAFRAQARIIRLDSRGRGKSDFDPTFMNYSVLQEAHDVLTLLDVLSLDQVAILGTSRGGLIAMTLAAIAPQRLSGVILNDIGPDIDPEGMSHIMGYLGRPPAFSSLSDAVSKLPAIMAPAFSNISEQQWHAYARRLWTEGASQLELRYDPKLRDALEAQAKLGDMPDLWPLFDAFGDIPVGVLRGENSNILSPGCVAEMQRRRPDMMFASVANRGHVPFLDEPECAQLISSFLRQMT